MIYFFFAVPFITLGLIFAYVDTQTNLIFYRYNHEYQSNERLSKIYKDIIPTVAFNLFVLHPILSYLTNLYIEINYTPFSILEFCNTSIVVIIIYQVVFFFFHKLLHTPLLYNLIHYKHHELNVSVVGIGGLYFHPLEYIFGSFLPGFLGLVFIRTHNVYTIYILSILAGSGAIMTHCGYYGNHVKHHYLRYCYYDLYNILDYVFGSTQKDYIRLDGRV